MCVGVLQSQSDYLVLHYVARILELVVPLMDHPSENFLMALEEDMIKLILKHGMMVSNTCFSVCVCTLVCVCVFSVSAVLCFCVCWYLNNNSLGFRRNDLTVAKFRIIGITPSCGEGEWLIGHKILAFLWSKG